MMWCNLINLTFCSALLSSRLSDWLQIESLQKRYFLIGFKSILFARKEIALHSFYVDYFDSIQSIKQAVILQIILTSATHTEA